MTVLDAPRTTPLPAPTATLTRVAGVLALAHVVLMLGGFSLERSTLLGDGVAQARHAYVEGSLARAMTGGYIESLAFVVLLPVLVFLARVFGRRTETGRWAAQTGLAAGVCNVAITLAAGMPAGAAAMYGGHHGADLHTALMVVDIRNFAFFLSLLMLGAHAACVGASARADKVPSRWIGIGGPVVGLLLVVSVAGAGMEWQNYATMAWIVWWVGLAVLLLRNRGIVAADEAR
jgi:hypothetical protein